MKTIRSLLLVFLVTAFCYGSSVLYVIKEEQEQMKKELGKTAQCAEGPKDEQPQAPKAPQPVQKVEKIVERVVEKSPESWSAIQTQIDNTVVQIFTQIGQFHWLEPYRPFIQGECCGTGFFINEEGYLITNAHVVDCAKAIEIQIPVLGKERISAEIVGISFERDLALLKVDPDGVEQIKQILGSIPVLKFGNSDDVHRADEVLAIGYPLGQQGLKSTKGVVSGHENLGNRSVIQIDAAINRGNSGGPAINISGEVIGINTYGINHDGAQNVGYIIPVNELKVIIESLYDTPGKIVRKPYLGSFYNAGSQALTKYLGNPQPGGPYITEVVPGSLMDEAGVKSGDMIYAIDSHAVDIFGELLLPGTDDRISLADYVAYIKIGKKVNMTIYRKSKKKEISFIFKESTLPAIRVKYPDYETINYTVAGGLVVQELCRNLVPMLLSAAPELITYEEPKNQMETVLIITHVIQDSAAQKSRVLVPGMRIKELNGIEVKTVDQFNLVLKKSLLSGYVSIKTFNGIFAVLPLAKILKDEQRLALMNHYVPSQVIQEMIAIKQKDEKQKETAGSSFTGTVIPAHS